MNAASGRRFEFQPRYSHFITVFHGHDTDSRCGCLHAASIAVEFQLLLQPPHFEDRPLDVFSHTR